MKRFVYILLLINGQYYIGSTNDIERRFADHVGWNTPTTKRIPVKKMLFKRAYMTKAQARKVEMFLKKQKSKLLVEKFMSDEREET